VGRGAEPLMSTVEECGGLGMPTPSGVMRLFETIMGHSPLSSPGRPQPRPPRRSSASLESCAPLGPRRQSPPWLCADFGRGLGRGPASGRTLGGVPPAGVAGLGACRSESVERAGVFGQHGRVSSVTGIGVGPAGQRCTECPILWK